MKLSMSAFIWVSAFGLKRVLFRRVRQAPVPYRSCLKVFCGVASVWYIVFNKRAVHPCPRPASFPSRLRPTHYTQSLQYPVANSGASFAGDMTRMFYCDGWMDKLRAFIGFSKGAIFGFRD